MNIIDLAIWAVLILSLMLGYYQGLVKSSLMAGGCCVSLLGAGIFYPTLARSIGSNADIVSKLIYYAEGSEIIGGIRISSLPAAKVPADVLERVIAGDWVLPHVPLNTHLGNVYYENVTHQVFAAGGANTLGDYLCNTIAQMTINLVSFILVFALIFVICTVLVYLCDNVFQFPVLRMGDGLLGGLVGMGTGALVVTVLFLIVPAVQSYLPITLLQELIDDSALCRVFLDGNFLLSFLPGYIG